MRGSGFFPNPKRAVSFLHGKLVLPCVGQPVTNPQKLADMPHLTYMRACQKLPGLFPPWDLQANILPQHLLPEL